MINKIGTLFSVPILLFVKLYKSRRHHLILHRVLLEQPVPLTEI